MQRAARLDEWQTILRTWTREHTTADIIEQARLFRIPVAQVGKWPQRPRTRTVGCAWHLCRLARRPKRPELQSPATAIQN